MPTRARNLLRTNYIPNGTAGSRYDLREFMWGRATAHDCQRATAELFDSDDVFHANSLRLQTLGMSCGATWKDVEARKTRTAAPACFSRRLSGTTFRRRR